MHDDSYEIPLIHFWTGLERKKAWKHENDATETNN